MLSSPSSSGQNLARLLGAFALLWAGLIIGVSFVASSARFLAPDLSLPIALQIGVVTFGVLQKINWGALLISALLAWLSGTRTAKGLWLLLLGMELFLDSLVLPVLSARAALYMGSTPLPPGTWHHAAYGITEVARVLVLLFWAFLCLRSRRESAP